MTTRERPTDAPPSRVLAFSPAFLPGYKAGGPIKSLVETLRRLPSSVVVTLVTADRDIGDSDPYPGLSGRVIPHGRHEVYYVNTQRASHWLALLRWCRRTRIDLLYLNSLWSPHFTSIPLVAHRVGALKTGAVLLAPRGELSPGALRLKRLKKQLFLPLIRPILKATDPIWQASTDIEAQHIATVFPWARVHVQADSLGDAPRNQPLDSSERPRFVFISRVAPMKNLRLALQALLLVPTELEFHIYGPIEDQRYWEACRSLLSSRPPNIHARYRGPLRPEQVQETLAEFDGFIFPTLGENFGHIIPESLSAGCPLICSTNTSWSAIIENGGGTVLQDMDPRCWANEIRSWAEQSPAERTKRKKAALESYQRWRESADSELSILVLLERFRYGLPTERITPYTHARLGVQKRSLPRFFPRHTRTPGT